MPFFFECFSCIDRLAMATSQPSSGLIPPFVAFWQPMAPYMFPWSVRARAVCPSCWQAFTRSLIQFAPSSRLYSLWTWRWQKSGAAMAVVPRGARGVPGRRERVRGKGRADPGVRVPAAERLPGRGGPRRGDSVEAMGGAPRVRGGSVRCASGARGALRVGSRLAAWASTRLRGPSRTASVTSRFLRIGIACMKRASSPRFMIDSSTSHSRVLRPCGP